jgi:hypothetical protein
MTTALTNTSDLICNCNDSADFIRHALLPSAKADATDVAGASAHHLPIRLDGRGLGETRLLRLLLARDEACSEATASLGYTK